MLYEACSPPAARIGDPWRLFKKFADCLGNFSRPIAGPWDNLELLLQYELPRYAGTAVQQLYMYSSRLNLVRRNSETKRLLPCSLRQQAVAAGSADEAASKRHYGP